MTQYSKRMVIAHWLTLALLIVAWFLGDAVNEARHEGHATLVGYAAHGLVGGAVLLLPISGVMQVVTSKVCDALRAWDAALLPAKFDGVPAHEVHEILVTVLIVLAVVHVLGAIKHQFIMKDGLMERMSLRKKD